MILKKAHIKNFRSLRDVEISFERQTAILGGNGAGKSTILKAIEKFYGSSGSVGVDDYFGKNTEDPIEIGLTFADFSQAELDTFSSHINDQQMNVVRVFDFKAGKNSGRYYGYIRGHAPFIEIRNAEAANLKKASYKILRESDPELYTDLETISKAEEIEAQLSKWELKHPNHCTIIRDNGQFLGFTNVAKGSLSKSTSFVFIPAVRDAAADAIDNRTSAIARLMELVVKSAVQRRQDFQDWQEKTTAEYKNLVSPDNLVELQGLASDLTVSLRMLYEETAVSLEWQPAGDFTVPLPVANVSLEDGGFPASVERQGNGLQRAFILTLLQHLARATVLSTQNDHGAIKGEGSSDAIEGTITNVTGVPEKTPLLPGLILAIEEPELYQHPTKQRHFARVLSDLSTGVLPGVAAEMQVIYASHSPYFVCVDRFDEVRLTRRMPVPEASHKECLLRESSLKRVCMLLENAYKKPVGAFKEDDLRARLHILTPELAEGFFADVVVLVEGESDRAALRAMAASKKIDFEALGVAVLPANGKNNLDRPWAIFRSLEIPVYAMWDCDKVGDKIEAEQTNLALLRLCGIYSESALGAITRIENTFACFENKLERTLQEEIGADHLNAAIEMAKKQFSVIRHEDAIKAPAIMKVVLTSLMEKGLRSASLENILDKIIALKKSVTTQI